MKTDDSQTGTRQRLITAMCELLKRKGLHGFGLSNVLAQAGAPKGVLYHHFPGGKVELAIVAIRTSVSQIISALEQLKTTGQSPVEILKIWLAHAQKSLESSGFEQGCPLAAVALESSATDQALRQVLEEGFSAIRTVLAQMLMDAGIAAERATRFSTLIVSAYEGALLQSRIAGSPKPATEAMELLLELIQLEIEKTRGHS